MGYHVSYAYKLGARLASSNEGESERATDRMDSWEDERSSLGAVDTERKEGRKEGRKEEFEVKWQQRAMHECIERGSNVSPQVRLRPSRLA
jgi:hypothetical protein